MESLDRKSTRLNSSHTEIYTLSLHDALPIFCCIEQIRVDGHAALVSQVRVRDRRTMDLRLENGKLRSEEHTSELQSHRDLHSFPTRRSSDLLLHRADPRRWSRCPRKPSPRA